MLIGRTLNKILAERIREGNTPSIERFILAPADLALVAVTKKAASHKCSNRSTISIYRTSALAIPRRSTIRK